MTLADVTSVGAGPCAAGHLPTSRTQEPARSSKGLNGRDHSSNKVG